MARYRIAYVDQEDLAPARWILKDASGRAFEARYRRGVLVVVGDGRTLLECEHGNPDASMMTTDEFFALTEAIFDRSLLESVPECLFCGFHSPDDPEFCTGCGRRARGRRIVSLTGRATSTWSCRDEHGGEHEIVVVPGELRATRRGEDRPWLVRVPFDPIELCSIIELDFEPVWCETCTEILDDAADACPSCGAIRSG